MVRLSFAEHAFVALPQAALYWPDRRALLVADLHFEKASWFARFGQMLPPYDSMATLGDLTKIIHTHDVREIWCLGDNFHDQAGASRLPSLAREMLQKLTKSHRWVWVTGNHDARLDTIIGGEIVEETVVDGIVLRHEADPRENRPEISGHFHPKLRVAMRGRIVSRRCFIASEAKLILPAFGAFTGGLDARHPEIRRAVGGAAQAIIPLGDRLLRFPLAA